MATKILFRRDTAANWVTANPTLDLGELGYEQDTSKFKIGNGTSAWTDLAYASGTGTVDVEGLATTEYVDTRLDSKAATGYVDTVKGNLESQLATLASTSYVDSRLDTKADRSYVDSQVATVNSGGTVDLSGYVTDSQLNTQLSAYTTQASLSSQLSGYATQGDLSGFITASSLSGYATNTSVSSQLSAYATTASLSNYATTQSVSSQLSEYATTSSVTSQLSNFATTAYVQGVLDDYATVADLAGYATPAMVNFVISTKDISDFTDNNGLLNHFSGSYNDLTDKPTIPSLTGYATEAYVAQAVVDASGGNVDLSGYATTVDLNNAIAGIGDHFSGNYNDLTNKPTIPSIAGLASTTYVDDAVAAVTTFSGSYNDLTNKPTIPTVPTNLSDFTNDVPFATVDQVIALGQQYVAADDLITANYQAADTAITAAYLEADAATLITANQYTDNAVITSVASLVDSAPAALNTLNELAAALGDDPNFATTVNNNIASKLSLSGGTMTGDLTLNGAPTNINHAVHKGYVDAAVAAVSSSGSSPTLLSELVNDTNFISKDTSGPMEWVDLGANTALYWGESNTNITGNSGIIDMKPNGTGVASFETTGLVIDLLKDIRYQKNNGVYTTLDFAGTVNSDDHTIIIPDASGTMALTSDIPTDINQLNDVNNLLSSASGTGAINLTGFEPTTPFDIDGSGLVSSSDALSFMKLSGGTLQTQQQIVDSTVMQSSWAPESGSVYSDTKFRMHLVKGNATDALREGVGLPAEGHGDTFAFGNIDNSGSDVQLVSGFGLTGNLASMVSQGSSGQINITTMGDGAVIRLTNRMSPIETTGAIELSRTGIEFTGTVTHDDPDPLLKVSTADPLYVKSEGIHNSTGVVNWHVANFAAATALNIVVRAIQPDYGNPQEGVLINKLLQFRPANNRRWIDGDAHVNGGSGAVHVGISRLESLNPVRVTALNHGLTGGEEITIHEAGPMTQLNGNNYFIKFVSTSRFELYTDAALTVPVDGTTFTEMYTNTGTGYEWFRLASGSEPLTPSDGSEWMKLAMDLSAGYTAHGQGGIAAEQMWDVWNELSADMVSDYYDLRDTLFNYTLSNVDYTNNPVFENAPHLGNFTGAMDVVIGNGNNNLKIASAVPASSIGKEGDTAGFFAADANYFYYCVGAFDGATDIWKRVALTGGSW